MVRAVPVFRFRPSLSSWTFLLFSLWFPCLGGHFVPLLFLRTLGFGRDEKQTNFLGSFSLLLPKQQGKKGRDGLSGQRVSLLVPENGFGGCSSGPGGSWTSSGSHDGERKKAKTWRQLWDCVLARYLKETSVITQCSASHHGACFWGHTNTAENLTTKNILQEALARNSFTNLTGDTSQVASQRSPKATEESAQGNDVAKHWARISRHPPRT